MAFKYQRDVTDEEQKYLSVASQLRTPNDQPVPTAAESISTLVETAITSAVGLVKATNQSRRSEAIKNADDATKAAVDAALGIEPIEGKP